MTLDVNRGDRLRAERSRLRLTQEQIAERVGVRREQWFRYEGGAEPGASVLTRAQSVGIDVFYVLTGERLDEKRQQVAVALVHTPSDKANSFSSHIGERLKRAREELDLTQQQAGDLVGVTREQWGKYERGQAVPGGEIFSSLAAAGADVHFILTGNRGEKQSYLPQSEQQYPLSTATDSALHYVVGGQELSFAVVPRYSARVSAGYGNGQGSYEQIGAFAFETNWMRQNLGRSGSGFASVQVHGDSMQPTLLHGDEIVIDLQVLRVDVSGIYVIALRGDMLVKRIQRKLDGSLVVKSDNSAYEPETITADKADEFSVVGRMVWPRVR